MELSDKKKEITAFFAALSIFLSTIEYLFPKPFPFFRLGIANFPILLGLNFLSVKDLFILFILKAFGQALINGTLISYVFIFSFTGSLTSLSVMILLNRINKKYISLTGISAAGAVSSSIIQLIFAVKFIFGSSALVIAPLLLGVSLISGVLLGLFTQEFQTKSEWLKKIKYIYQ
jgi:heptaprenyl diphosphate synthase